MFSNREKADEALREVDMRKSVYARRVAAGQMKQKAANRKIAVMQEIADEYGKLADSDDKADRLL